MIALVDILADPIQSTRSEARAALSEDYRDLTRVPG